MINLSILSELLQNRNTSMQRQENHKMRPQSIMGEIGATFLMVPME